MRIPSSQPVGTTVRVLNTAQLEQTPLGSRNVQWSKGVEDVTILARRMEFTSINQSSHESNWKVIWAYIGYLAVVELCIWLLKIPMMYLLFTDVPGYHGTYGTCCPKHDLITWHVQQRHAWGLSEIASVWAVLALSPTSWRWPKSSGSTATPAWRKRHRGDAGETPMPWTGKIAIAELNPALDGEFPCISWLLLYTEIYAL